MQSSQLDDEVPAAAAAELAATAAYIAASWAAITKLYRLPLRSAGSLHSGNPSAPQFRRTSALLTGNATEKVRILFAVDSNHQSQRF